MRRDQQPLHRLPVLKVVDDDVRDVGFVNVGVPVAFWIHHSHRAGCTAIQTPRLVDAYLPCAIKTHLFDQRFAVVESGLRPVPGTARLAVWALVEAKKDVSLEVRRSAFHALILAAPMRHLWY